MGLKPSGQQAPTKVSAPTRENRPIFKPAWKPRGNFLGHIGSVQKPKAPQPASYLQENHVSSPSDVLPSVPCGSSHSQVDPKSLIPAEVVPMNMVVTSSDANVVACSNIGKSESAIQNPKVSFVFLKPQVLNLAPTLLSEPILINEVRNFEKSENPHADLVSTPQISSCSVMVVLESNSTIDSGLV